MDLFKFLWANVDIHNPEFVPAANKPSHDEDDAEEEEWG